MISLNMWVRGAKMICCVWAEILKLCKRIREDGIIQTYISALAICINEYNK